MKIFLVGPVWHGYFTEYSAAALQSLGYKLNIFYNNNFEIETIEDKLLQKIPQIPFTITDTIKRQLHARKKWKRDRLINQEFVKQVLAASPDLVIMLIAWNNLIWADSVKKIKEKLNVPVVVWFLDEPSTSYENTKIIFYADYFFVIDPPLISQLRVLTNRPVGYLTNAVNPDIFKPVELSKEERNEYECDIGFVGGANYRANGLGLFRAKVLESLRHRYQVKIYGNPTWGKLLDNDFPYFSSSYGGRLLPVEETNKFYNAAKIIMNIHHPSLKCGVNGRIFEIPAAGGFQLVDKKSEIANLFEVGKDIICYENQEELGSLVDYYLNHPEERKEIAQRARKKVLQKHTFVHRMKAILENIK